MFHGCCLLKFRLGGAGDIIAWRDRLAVMAVEPSTTIHRLDTSSGHCLV